MDTSPEHGSDLASTLSSPSTEEIKGDFLSSYTQIESSTFEASQVTDLSSSDDEGAPDLDEEDGLDSRQLPELSSQIVEWSKEREESYDVEEQIQRNADLLQTCSIDESEQLVHVQKQLLEDLDKQSKKLSINLSHIMAFMKRTSEKITQDSVHSIKTFEETQNDLSENVDQNIKVMYRVIAQSYELDKSLLFTEDLSKKIRKIRQTVEQLEKLVQIE